MTPDKELFSKFLKVMLACTIVLSSLHPIAGYTQSSSDRQLPLINHTVSTEPDASLTAVFQAEVSDNVGIKLVSLLHRFDGEQEYSEIEMKQTNSVGIYEAQVPVSKPQKKRIEYFIIAEDTSGNTVLEGYAFAPLTRLLAPAPADFSAASQAPSSVSPPQKSNKWYYVLGAAAVVVLGTLVADSRGGGDGGSASASNNECVSGGTCVVEFTVPNPKP